MTDSNIFTLKLLNALFCFLCFAVSVYLLLKGFGGWYWGSFLFIAVFGFPSAKTVKDEEDEEAIKDE